MSFRKAQLILLLIILLPVTFVFLVIKDSIDAPWAAIYIGTIIVVGGPLFAILATNADAVATVQGLFDKEAKAAKAYDLNSDDNKNNRKNIIGNVHHAWIKGVLQQALHKKVAIELDLEFEPTALTRQLEMWEGQPVHRPVPTNKSISDLFDETGQALLILGAPGSGKTIALLELCRDLLKRARKEAQARVPVVLNLSTWATNPKQPLDEWIVAQLHRRYQLIPFVGRIWLEENQLCLLLDGLDEVALNVRDDCVQAINEFRTQYSTPIVVCSRIEDYNKLAEQLNLSTAVVIQPLDEDKVTAYLTHKKLKLQVVHEAVQQDDALRRLSRTPLMLNIMALAYGGFSRKQLTPLMQDEDGRRRHLYDAYITRMFRRRPLQSSRYNIHSALTWLTFLATQLTQREETEFFLEELQPSWLPPISVLRYPRLLGLIFGSLFGLWSVMLVAVLSELLVEDISKVLVFVSGFGMVIGLILGFFFGMAGIIDLIKPVEAMDWRRLDLHTSLSILFFGLFPMLFFGLMFWATFGLFFGLLIGLFCGLVSVGGVFVWWSLESVQSNHPRTVLNHGIRRSATNAIRAGLLLWLFIMPFFILKGKIYGALSAWDDVWSSAADGLFFTLNKGMYVGILLGLLGMLFLEMLLLGGGAVIQHYILRWMLHRHWLLPLRLVPFLRAMTERLVLQDAGAHFRFIHRSLQEHFAALSPADIDRLVRTVDAESGGETAVS